MHGHSTHAPDDQTARTRDLSRLDTPVHMTAAARRFRCECTKEITVYFYRAALNAGRSSYEKAVRPSVRPCACQTRGLWQNGRKICPYFHTIRNITWSSFLTVGGGPILPEILRQPAPVGAKSPIFSRYSLVSASAVTKKVQLTLNRMSTMRFPMSLRWTSYVASTPKEGGGAKTRNGRFPSTIALCLKKACYKVSLCQNWQRQRVRHSLAICIRTKMIGGEHHLLHENLADTDPPTCKAPIFNIGLLSLVAQRLSPKTSQLTLIWSPLYALPMSLTRTS